MLTDIGLTVARQIPPETLAGLASGLYSLHGGVVRDVGGRIVSHLVTSGAPTALGNLIPGLGLLTSLVQSGQLRQLGRDVAQVQTTLNSVLSLSIANTALSGLGLVTSVAGFAYLSQRFKAVDAKLAQIEKQIKDVKAWQESLQRSELQAAVDGARQASNQDDRALRRGLLIESRRQFNTLSHHYKQQWARSEIEADVRSINELYTLSIMGYALVSSDLGLRDTAADLKANCHDWTQQARQHVKRLLFAERADRLMDADHLDILPARTLVELLDFAHDTQRGIDWIDQMRVDSAKNTSVLDSITLSAPKRLRQVIHDRKPDSVIEMAKALRARAQVLDASVAHHEFLQEQQLSASRYQNLLEQAVADSGQEAICVQRAPWPLLPA